MPQCCVRVRVCVCVCVCVCVWVRAHTHVGARNTERMMEAPFYTRSPTLTSSYFGLVWFHMSAVKCDTCGSFVFMCG